MADRHKRTNETRKSVHSRAVTETISVSSAESIPEGYVRIPLPSPPIFAKAQVLSHHALKPIFVEGDHHDEGHRVAYWVHEEIVPELAEWIRCRVFPQHDILPLDQDDES